VPVDDVVAVLRAGGTVVLPTDTVCGLAALPTDNRAMARLHALKGRSSDQPVAVLVADADQAAALLADPGPDAERWMATLWPGPLTIVARRAEAARGFALGGDPDTIGVRCPDDDAIRAIASQVGPLAATSANRHGEPTPERAVEAAAALLGAVDLVVDVGVAGTVASTVVDVTVEPWVVRRVGAVSELALRASSGKGGNPC